MWPKLELFVCFKQKKRNRAWMWPTFEFEFSKTKSKIGHGGDRKSNLNIYKRKRNRAWRWPKFEFKFSKTPKYWLEVTEVRICFMFLFQKQKNTNIYNKEKTQTTRNRACWLSTFEFIFVLQKNSSQMKYGFEVAEVRT